MASAGWALQLAMAKYLDSETFEMTPAPNHREYFKGVAGGE